MLHKKCALLLRHACMAVSALSLCCFAAAPRDKEFYVLAGMFDYSYSYYCFYFFILLLLYYYYYWWSCISDIALRLKRNLHQPNQATKQPHNNNTTS